MTKDVLLSICGIQDIDDGEYRSAGGPVEVLTPAEYYFKNGKHYLLYDEVDSEDRSVTRTTLKIQDDCLSVSHKGDTQAHLLIEGNKRNVTYYATPFGSLHIVLDGRSVEVDASENLITAQACYGLEINYEHVAECEVRIRVTPRNE